MLGEGEELGTGWREKFYDPIRKSLGIDEGRDLLSRDVLWDILEPRGDPISLREAQKNFENKVTIVFGAGPSLLSDLEALGPFIKAKNPAIISADGAADALAEKDFESTAVVSDLDSCSEIILQKNSENGFVFAHAHGDNLELVKNVVPTLGRNTFGTTQVASRDPIRNFGGFTDGDRACYLASAFRASNIIIAGMDFGRDEGTYSIDRYSSVPNPRRAAKLEWGRKSLEYLISERKEIRFYNVTKFGIEITGATRVAYDRFM